MKKPTTLLRGLLFYRQAFVQLAGRKFYLYILVTGISVLLENLGLVLVLPIISQSLNDTPPNTWQFNSITNVFSFLELPVSIASTLMLTSSFILISFGVRLMGESFEAWLLRLITVNLRKKMISAFFKVDYQYCLNYNTGRLTNIILGEAGKAIMGFRIYSTALVNLILISVNLMFAFFLNWKFAIFASITGFLLSSIFNLVSTRISKVSKEISLESGRFNHWLIQVLQAFKYLLSTHRSERINQNVFESIDTLARKQYKIQLGSGVLQSSKDPAAYLFLLSMIYVFIVILKSDMALVMVTLIFLFRVILKLTNLHNEWQGLMGQIGGVETVLDFIHDIEQHKEPLGTQSITNFKQGISLKNLHFKYGDNQVLSDINLDIARNSTIAIVGPSGAGKSTLVDLITGILRATGGTVCIDGISYDQINIQLLREKIGYVTQECVIFDDSIAQNISLWESDNIDAGNIQQVEDAAKLAYADEFINDLEDGYNTIVGDRGVRLSGGQRQRIAIARELYKQPEILIFDEATSALDSESERFIQQSIHDLKGRMTIIMIAHRLSTVKNADYIYVLEDGRIAESGTFRELIANPTSKFKSMIELQNIDVGDVTADQLTQ